MNWAKLKNILIIIFLILNGILGYMNYQKRIEAFTLSAYHESNIKKLLYDNNIMVYTLLPQKYPPMRKLILIPENAGGEEEVKILKAIFGESKNLMVYTETTKENEKQTVYSKDNKKVGFLPGRISYEANLNLKEPVIYTKEQSKKLADEFLTNLGYNLSKLEWNFKDEGNGNYRYYYYEVYKGSFIYNSYVEFLIKPQGVERANIYRMKPIRHTGFSRSIYAPDEILFGFMNEIKKVQKPAEILVIQRIDLGYRMESEAPWTKEEEGIPYYRITLADGKYFYINAYTNEMQ